MNDPDIDDLIQGLQDTVSFVNKFLENNAQKNTDEDDIKDAALLSDGPAPASVSGNNGESLSYSYVRSHTETLHQKEEIQDRIDTLLSLAETCNIPLKDDKKHWISQRAPKPFNKFAEKNNALGQAFPQIFPLGNVYSMQSDITPAQT